MNIAVRLSVATVVSGAIVLLGGSSASRAQGSAEAELVALEHAWIDATLKRDANAFAAFMADGYVAVVANAQLRTKSEWVDRVRSGSLSYDAVSLRNLKVRRYDDTAVVTGEYAQTATLDGQDYSARGVYATTWLKRDGRWQAIASGFSRAAAR